MTSARDTSNDAPCPICGELSEHIPGETVHNGVAQVPVEPDAWICATHGHWMPRDGGPGFIVERPDSRQLLAGLLALTAPCLPRRSR